MQTGTGRDAPGWAKLMRATAGSPRIPLEGSPAAKRACLDEFRDERGHRRAVDRPVLARLLGMDPGERPRTADREVLLWWAVHDPDADPWPLIEGDGPLLGLDMDLGIEAWTEAEFAALHALSWIALRRGDAAAMERLLRAAEWHMRETQPDNGTNHPWAVHVFAHAGERTPDAAMYAEGILHNCLIGGSGGAAGAFSAVLLLDAAAWMEASAAARR